MIGGNLSRDRLTFTVGPYFFHLKIRIEQRLVHRLSNRIGEEFLSFSSFRQLLNNSKQRESNPLLGLKVAQIIIIIFFRKK
jgi:hypothetical protein